MLPHSTTTPLSILVVDDHALVREAFTAMLRGEFPGALVDSAASCAEAMAAVRQQTYEVVLVDIELGDRSGLELTMELRTLQTPPAIIAVSMHQEETFVKRTLQLGACAYVTKEAPPQELFNAIKEARSGRRYLSRQLAERISQGQASDKSVSVALHNKLSNRELEVLIQLAKGKSLQQMAQDLSLSAKTVAVHKHNLSRKTGLHSTLEIFKHCKAHGLV